MTTNSIEDLNPGLKDVGRYEFGWADSDDAGAVAKRGLNEEIVRDISSKKDEPQWMLDQRLKGLRLFERKPMPTWGAELDGIDFDNIKYFVRSSATQAQKVGPVAFAVVTSRPAKVSNPRAAPGESAIPTGNGFCKVARKVSPLFVEGV